MTFVRGLVGLLGVIAFTAAVPATAKPRLQVVGSASPGVMAASGSDLVYLSAPGTARILDANLKQVATVNTSAACGWTGVGAQSLVATCFRPSEGYTGAIYDRKTGAISRLPAVPPPASADSSEQWSGIGTDWLEGSFQGYHYDGRVFVNRNTGDTRDERLLEGDHRKIEDLNTTRLWRTMCRPLHAGYAVDVNRMDDLTRAPYVYKPPYGAGFSQHHLPDRGRIIFGRCGQSRQRTLSACHSIFCTPPALGDHAVAWTDGTALVVYLIDRHTFWRWPHAVKRGIHLAPVIAGRRLFFTQGPMDPRLPTWTVDTVLLPRATP